MSIFESRSLKRPAQSPLLGCGDCIGISPTTNATHTLARRIRFSPGSDGAVTRHLHEEPISFRGEDMTNSCVDRSTVAWRCPRRLCLIRARRSNDDMGQGQRLSVARRLSWTHLLPVLFRAEPSYFAYWQYESILPANGQQMPCLTQ